MIHMQTFSGYSEEDCIRKINDELDEDQIINVIPKGSRRFQGYDEYDTDTYYFMQVFYKGKVKNERRESRDIWEGIYP